MVVSCTAEPSLCPPVVQLTAREAAIVATSKSRWVSNNGPDNLAGFYTQFSHFMGTSKNLIVKNKVERCLMLHQRKAVG